MNFQCDEVFSFCQTPLGVNPSKLATGELICLCNEAKAKIVNVSFRRGWKVETE